MALSQTKFRKAADRLFSKAMEGNLTLSAEFSQPSSIDPITGVETSGVSEVVTVVPESYNEAQVDGQAIQRGDFKLLARYQSFDNFNPTVGGYNLTVNGKNYTVVNVKNDFDILYTLQVRAS